MMIPTRRPFVTSQNYSKSNNFASGFDGSCLIDDAVSQCAAEMTWKSSACGATFNSRTRLKSHMKGHLGQLDFSCEICGKKFWNMVDLQGHISAKHTNIKVHVCHVCGKSFSYRKTLARHKKNDHGTDDSGIISTIALKSLGHLPFGK